MVLNSDLTCCSDLPIVFIDASKSPSMSLDASASARAWAYTYERRR